MLFILEKIVEEYVFVLLRYRRMQFTWLQSMQRKCDVHQYRGLICLPLQERIQRRRSNLHA